MLRKQNIRSYADFSFSISPCEWSYSCPHNRNIQPRSRSILVTLPSVVLFSTKNLPQIHNNLRVSLSFLLLQSCTEVYFNKKTQPQLFFLILFICNFPLPFLGLGSFKRNQIWQKISRQANDFQQAYCRLLFADFFRRRFLANCSVEINYFPTPTLSTEFSFHIPSLSVIAGEPRFYIHNISGNWKKKSANNTLLKISKALVVITVNSLKTRLKPHNDYN